MWSLATRFQVHPKGGSPPHSASSFALLTVALCASIATSLARTEVEESAHARRISSGMDLAGAGFAGGHGFGLPTGAISPIQGAQFHKKRGGSRTVKDVREYQSIPSSLSPSTYHLALR